MFRMFKINFNQQWKCPLAERRSPACGDGIQNLTHAVSPVQGEQLIGLRYGIVLLPGCTQQVARPQSNAHEACFHTLKLFLPFLKEESHKKNQIRRRNLFGLPLPFC